MNVGVWIVLFMDTRASALKGREFYKSPNRTPVQSGCEETEVKLHRCYERRKQGDHTLIGPNLVDQQRKLSSPSPSATSWFP